MPTIGLAWILATHPDAKVRNPSEAVRMGERLAELSAYQNWMSLDALAAAYAAANRFPDAVKTAERALELVRSTSPPDAAGVANRVNLYRQGRPYFESEQRP